MANVIIAVLFWHFTMAANYHLKVSTMLSWIYFFNIDLKTSKSTLLNPTLLMWFWKQTQMFFNFILTINIPQQSYQQINLKLVKFKKVKPPFKYTMMDTIVY
jgi:hypothetical protein